MLGNLPIYQILAFQVLIMVLINFEPFSSTLESFGLHVLQLKHISPKEREPQDQYQKPLFPKVFSNPTPYENIANPITAPESYIPNLKLDCYVYNPNHLNIIIRDADKERYEIPFEEPYPHPKNPKYLKIEESNFEFDFESEPFDFIVRRKATKEVIFKLTDRLVYTDLYIEFSFFTPTKEIYGLGLRLSPFHFKPGTYTLFTVDRSGHIDDGKSGLNGPGHHSMYLMKENSGNYHVFLLRNVAFGEVTIYKENKMKWQLVGGVLDFNFFLGDSPESAVDRYHQYLDGWAMPGFWHLGYHLNKWGGYMNASALRGVLENFESRSIPLETLWTDADHMIDGINFSIDEERYPLDEIREMYQKHKKRWVPIFDAHISLPLSGPAAEYPNVEEIYMYDSLGDRCDGGFVWGTVTFMDFLNPKTELFWDKMIWENNEKWELSGIWIDANEIANFRKFNPAAQAKDVNRKYYNLPFYPGKKNLYDLETVNLDCKHYNGHEELNARTWDALFQSKYVYNSLKKKFPYPFILSRSSMFGGSKYHITWISDVYSAWPDLKASTAVLLNYGIFGYAMNGVDICGFGSHDTAEPELCARWHQVATFYPFARNSHVCDWNHQGPKYQEPFVYKGKFYDAIYSHIQLRYSILKYYYTLFFMKKTVSEERKIGSLMRPLLYDYYTDPTLPPYGHEAHETQFLLDKAIMVATVVYPDISSLDVYFPDARWFDLRSYEEVPIRGGFTRVSSALTETIPYFLRGGNILLKQNVDGVLRTEDLSNTFTIVAGLDELDDNGKSKQGYTEGNILGVKSYDEDYVYAHCTKQDCVLSVGIIFEYAIGQSTMILVANEKFENSYVDGIRVNEIVLMGAPKEFFEEVTRVRLDGHDNFEIEMELSVNGYARLKFAELDLDIIKYKYRFIFT